MFLGLILTGDACNIRLGIAFAECGVGRQKNVLAQLVIEFQPPFEEGLISRERRGGVIEPAGNRRRYRIQVTWQPNSVQFEDRRGDGRGSALRKVSALRAEQGAILENSIAAEIDPEKAGVVDVTIVRRPGRLRGGL